MRTSGRLSALALGFVSLGALLSGTSAQAADVTGGNQGQTVWLRSSAPVDIPLGSDYRSALTSQRSAVAVERLQTSETPPVPEPSSEADEQKIARDSGATYVAEAGDKAAGKRIRSAQALTKEQCRARADAHSTVGKVINHFSFCRWGYNTAVKLNGEGAVEGMVRFRETEIGTGSDNMRDALIEVHTDEVVASGKFNDSALMSFNVAQAGWPSASSCQVADISSNPFTTTVGDWRDEYIAYGLVSARGSGIGPDDIATCVYQHNWKVTGGGATTPWSGGPQSGLRFDSSKSLGSNFYDQGVVFDRVVPTFSYDRAQADTAGVAKHVYDALYKPQTTYPTKAGKVIPGDIWSGRRPLHRNWTNYDAAAAEVTRKNRNAKDAACRGLSRPNDTYQCDEFPFASTKEGAGVGDGNFSVRYVPGAENGQAGRELGTWYGSDRVLHNNEYGIIVY
ncbi:NucA/NucB deoxyribonuclease domain-containing protein [Streptomyces sp. AK04-3B]|uniref:NucA/NucB deoxyribonuclease domain-containing protein n=1 Tax=unclassified Streptomyces TaxID=2593676 RepID=UPI0029A1DD91|nr:NucA/NucB deoxyribonuclease domain-containing protein [Streptomyces sp. AK04-3B]MDX3797314.1 NucA/NucB deoxyribonuclease domain-containing protein [Streptomyces sp. AK04-3B]